VTRDVEDEIRFHLEERTRRNVAAGMDLPTASAAAYGRFGSIERAKRGMRSARMPTTATALVGCASIAVSVIGAAMYGRGATRIYDLGAGVTPPVPIARLNAEYSGAARQAKIQGTVRVRCVVRLNGACGDLAVVRSVDATLGLDNAAVKALREWRFKPAVVHGQPVPARIMVDFTFALR
jgi:TonB family protein